MKKVKQSLLFIEDAKEEVNEWNQLIGMPKPQPFENKTQPVPPPLYVPPPKKGILKRIVKTLFLLSFMTIVISGGVTYYVYKDVIYDHLNPDIPNLNSMISYRPPLISTVYSKEQKPIAEFYKERRILVLLDRMPYILIGAFLAAEDARFFDHKGFDLISIFRATINNLLAGKIVEGGSTITQQVAKAFVLSSEKSFARKLREVILAYHIEKQLDKKHILYLYLNHIYMGNGAYGVAAAAQNYFGKTIWELSIAQCAALAGLPQAPSKYNPFENYEGFKNRQEYVIRRMLDEKYITQEQADSAKREYLAITQKPNLYLENAPYYSEYVRQYVEDKYGKKALYTGGLKIYTSLDMRLHTIAQKELIHGLEAIEKRQHHNELLQGAILCMENGYIRVMIGGRDFSISQFNRALNAVRQPGSAFKPIIYASALDKGFTPASIIVDSPVVLPSDDKSFIWKPNNYEKSFFGPTRLRQALELSRNLVTIKLVQELGLNYVISYARKLGIKSPLKKDLSIALGSSGVTLMELVRAYNVFASSGKLVSPVFITKIEDQQGKILESNSPTSKTVIEDSTAYCMTSLLEGVVKRGTGWRIKDLHRPAAGKTGSTNNLFDAWFIGFTSEYVTGVWVGFDKNKSIGEKETGARAASPIWLGFMKKALGQSTSKSFHIPKSVEFATIDTETGLPVNANTKYKLNECFKKGTVPKLEPDKQEPSIQRSDFLKNNL